MPADKPYRHMRGYTYQHLVMTPGDADEFSRLLRAEFPTVKFLSREYWRPFFDAAAWKRDSDARHEAWKRGEPPPPRRYAMPAPVGKSLPYHDSLGSPAETDFLAWIEPPGWQPQWGGDPAAGSLYVVNAPEVWFEFRRGTFAHWAFPKGVNPSLSAAPPTDPADDHVVGLGDGYAFAKWYVDDHEACAFHRVVPRLLLRVTTVGHLRVDEERRRPFRPYVRRDKKDRDRYWRYGHDAERWALARRHNYFTDTVFRKPDTYPYAGEDFIRVEEMTARERKNHEEALVRVREYEAERAARAAARAKKAGSKPARSRRKP